MDAENKKVALVTGASRGIGAATALELAKVGYQVILNYNNNEYRAFENLQTLLQYESGHMVHKADVSKQEEVASMFNTIKEKYGRLDVLVNNAAVYGEMAPLEKQSVHAFRETFDTNFWGPVYCTQEALKMMKPQNHGRIFFMSVTLTERPSAMIAPYISSKAALEGLAMNTAMEGGRYGITSNIIVPPPLPTDMGCKAVKAYQNNADLLREHFITPLIPDLSAVGTLIAALCDQPAVTAQKFYVDNGWQRRYMSAKDSKK